MLKLGLIMLPATTGAMLFTLGREMDTIGILIAIIVSIQTLSIFVTILFTEKVLKKFFDEDGHRR